MALDVLQSCSEQSAAVGESLRGTATANVDVWVLLEHPGKWEADIAKTDVASSTRSWLDGITARIPRSRVLFIRRDRPASHLTCYVVTSTPERTAFRFQAGTHEELAQLDVDAIVARGAEAALDQGGARCEGIFLVCTHGKRDICCARKGVAFFRAMDAVPLTGELWQSSHQGGHRFAATMLCLPDGSHYGRLECEDAASLAARHAQGRLFDRTKYRGNTRLPPEAQAAEAWLRDELGEDRIDALEYLGSVSDDGAGRLSRFRLPNGAVHEIVVTVRPSGRKRLVSCDAESPTESASFEIVRHLAHP